MRRLLTIAAGAVACFGLLGAADASAQNAINQTPNQDYVAMGDSYSAGNGTNDYYETTCDRSNFAYGPLIDPQIPGTFSHPACSGARTNHIDQDGQQTYPKQIDLLGANTDYVTLTIGGNDAGFTDALQNCAIPFGGCADSGGTLDQSQAYIQNTLPALLDRNYASIRAKAPNAVVTVLGYPRIFKPNATCNLVFSAAEVNKANATADLLNDVMRQRVQAAGPGFAYVDSRTAWVGHGACDSVEWLNGFSVSDTVGSFHPNKTGYQAYAGMAASTLLAQRRVNQTIGPNGHIAFTSTRDGNSEIYVANASGTFPVDVTNDPGNDVDPVWSPDGTKLAFASNRDGDNEIYTVNADGSGLTKLTTNAFDDREPDWSPNGDYIAFRSNRSGNDEIWKMTSSGSGATNLTNNAAADQAPDWSPDGSEIAFQRVIGSGNTDVYRMNSDGQGQLDLTATTPADYVDAQPAWSPDGNLIAFQSNRDGDQEIYTVARISPPATPAVTPPAPVKRTSNSDADREPSFSPDGNRLTFTSDRDGNDEIYTATVSGAGTYPGQTRITNNGAGDSLATWQGDKTPPDTSIDTGPSGLTNLTTPTFTFSSTEPGSSFQCRVDSAAFAGCPTPFTTASLGEGQHTFDVRSTDPSGNLDTTPASRTFTVDTTPATTAITSGPTGGATTNDPTPEFEFASDDPQATFECKVDSDPFVTCTSPFTTASLGDGPHTFTVRGTDSAGNPDSQAASASFEVDATAPDTTIDFAPSSPTNDPQPSFQFSSNDVGATFECKLDGGAFEGCANPKQYASDLGDGEHTFSVRATDAAGNTDQSPDSATFTVDTSAPNTSITSSAPSASDNTPTFTFDSTEAGSSFECRIDTAAFTSCAPPFTTAQLPDGDHTFEVQATDAAGNVDATPASLGFTTDATAPETTVDSGPGRNNPGEQIEDTTPTFTFSSDDPAATYQCQVDSSPWVPCDQSFTTPELDLGSHTFRVRATDEAGNTDQSPASATFEVIDTTPPQTSIDAGPADDARIGDATPTFEFSSDETGSFECRVDSGTFATCTTPFTTSPLGNGEHTFEVRAVDQSDNRDASPASRTFTVDTTPPDTSITSGPTGATADSTPTFEFISDDNDATFECRVDFAQFQPCTSPRTTTSLGDGSHTFEVRATDSAGNIDGSSASRTFTVDTAPPDTSITSGPAGGSRINDTTPTFDFTSPDGGATFQCRVDGGQWADCATPFTTQTLGEGANIVEVRAVDAAGNVDPSPDSRTFIVDTTPPDTTITSTTPARINDTTPTFAFNSPDNDGIQFECRVDTDPFAPCSSPHTTAALSEGPHTFEVRAVDAATNPDPTPASVGFTVDTTAPDTAITAGPAAGATIGDPTPTFGFTSPDNGATFECRVDSGQFTACTTPFTTATLSDGQHTFEVRAADQATNADATPASRTFTVDTGPPSTTISNGPPTLGNDATPTFTFGADDNGATFECRVDGGQFTACTSPHSTASLSDGQHTFEVRATDGAGNVEATPASRDFTVDTVVKDTVISAKPKQKAKRSKFRVAIQVAAGERVDVEATGKLKAGHKSVALETGTATVESGTTLTLQLAPATKSGARKVKKRLAAHKKVKAQIAVTVTDEVGNQQTAKLKVKLK